MSEQIQSRIEKPHLIDYSIIETIISVHPVKTRIKDLGGQLKEILYQETNTIITNNFYDAKQIREIVSTLELGGALKPETPSGFDVTDHALYLSAERAKERFTSEQIDYLHGLGKKLRVL